ncbi:MAG: 3'-5' exonuclease [Rhodocyclaceae bacterium]|nr:3'-5' exonuclease [Rhodocyclaceae bacterium]
MPELFGLFGPDARRRRLLRKAPSGPLADYLSVPFPARDTDWREVPFLALDLETTGGDPARDEIVSFGWVQIDRERIVLSSARHRLVRLQGDMTATSAVVHRITDDEAATGEPLEAVMAELLAALAGRILVAHYIRTEVGFLEATCRRLYGMRGYFPAVDTLALAAAARDRERRAPRKGDLRLGNLRRQAGLPRYPAHNALSDALAAGELLLALASARRGRIDLGMLLKPAG